MSWSFDKTIEGRVAFEEIGKLVTELPAYHEHEGGKKTLAGIVALMQMAARDHHDKKSIRFSSYGHVDASGGGSYSINIEVSSQKGEWAMSEEELKVALKLLRDQPAPPTPVGTP